MLLPLDEELAQYFYTLWDVLEESPLFWIAVIVGLTTTTLTTMTTTASIATVLIIMMLELYAPQVSYVFGINLKILTAITVGVLVLATIDIVIILKFLPAVVILTAGLYAYCPVCDFPGRDMCWLYS